MLAGEVIIGLQFLAGPVAFGLILGKLRIEIKLLIVIAAAMRLLSCSFTRSPERLLTAAAARDLWAFCSSWDSRWL